jgi:DNA-binding LacI/PurR family transcriptional regulator
MFFGKVLAAISRRLGRSGYEPLILPADDDRADLHARQPHLARRFDATILIGVDNGAPVVHEVICGKNCHYNAHFAKRVVCTKPDR